MKNLQLRPLKDVLSLNNSHQKVSVKDINRSFRVIRPECFKSRFLCNKFLINPQKCFFQFINPHLEKYGIFSIVKPPFCPMKTSDAQNYSRLSVESLILLALESKSIKQWHTSQMSRFASQKILKPLVLYDLHKLGSGPIIVSLSPHFIGSECSSSTKPLISFEWEALILGHHDFLPQSGDEPLLFPLKYLYSDPLCTRLAKPGEDNSVCEVFLKTTAFYGVHPVSLIKIRTPHHVSSSPACIPEFLSSQLGLVVVGDPLFFHPSYYFSDSRKFAKTLQEKPFPHQMLRQRVETLISSVRRMGKDIDFPRCFFHLVRSNIKLESEIESVSLNPSESGTTENASVRRELTFRCENWIQSSLKPSPSQSLPSKYQKQFYIYDGIWTPDAS